MVKIMSVVPHSITSEQRRPTAVDSAHSLLYAQRSGFASAVNNTSYVQPSVWLAARERVSSSQEPPPASNNTRISRLS